MSTVSRQVGRRIRVLREAKRWSLETLASKVGLTRKGLSKIELGQVASSIDVYQRITRALGVALPSIFTPRLRSVSSGHTSMVRPSKRPVTRPDVSCTDVQTD